MNKKLLVLSLMSLTVIGLFTFSVAAYAQNNTAYVYQGPCGLDPSTNQPIKIGLCVINLYKWGLGAGVLLALIMIVFAGYKYITAGGNAQSVTSAKEMFTGAFIGLIILFAAVLILRTINPDLTNFNLNTNLDVSTSTNPWYK